MARQPQQPEFSATMLDRQPPCDLDAEQCVLGSMLLDHRVIDDAAMVLRPGDFWDDANATLYRVLCEMHERSQRIDLRLLLDQLRRQNLLDVIGGAAYLAKCSTSVPNAAHLRHYAKIVRDLHIRRRLINAGTDTIRDGFSPPDGDVERLMELAEQRMYRVSDELLEIGDEPTHMRDLMHDTLDRMERRARGEDDAVRLGFPALDRKLGGLHPGEVTVVGGRPAHGKTSLGLCLAHAASQCRHVLYVSLEMSKPELGDRLMAIGGDLDLQRIRTGRLSLQNRVTAMETATNNSEHHNVWVDDCPGRTMGQIAALVRRHQRRHELGLLVIDYLQLITPDNFKDSRQEQVARISRRVKLLARESNLPILLLAQVNRESGKGTGRAPRLAELRESGSIEQDADNVLFIHRPAQFDEELRPDNPQEAEPAELYVAKHRNGPTGECPLHWFRHRAMFASPAGDREAEFEEAYQPPFPAEPEPPPANEQGPQRRPGGTDASGLFD